MPNVMKEGKKSEVEYSHGPAVNLFADLIRNFMASIVIYTTDANKINRAVLYVYCRAMWGLVRKKLTDMHNKYIRDALERARSTGDIEDYLEAFDLIMDAYNQLGLIIKFTWCYEE